MENQNKEYVFVMIRKEADSIATSITTLEPAVTVDEAIEFLQKYKDEQTKPLI